VSSNALATPLSASVPGTAPSTGGQHRAPSASGARDGQPRTPSRDLRSYLSLALLLGAGAYAAFGGAWADPVGVLLMLPVILWQGRETLEQAAEDDDE
jgi:uncharacterized membrane protein YccC